MKPLSKIRVLSRVKIRDVLLNLPEGWDEKMARRQLRLNYPFQMKKGWRYRVWLQEIRFCLSESQTRDIDEILPDDAVVHCHGAPVIGSMVQWARQKNLLHHHR